MYEGLKESLREKFIYWGSDINDEDVLDFTEYNLKSIIHDSSKFLLYRYMPANYFNIRNIETQTIHLSPNGIFNDIYEGIPSTDYLNDYFKIENLKDLAYITCLTENNDNMLMWSHYADSHKGICIEYNLKRIVNDPHQIILHLFPVIYCKERIINRDIDSLVKNLSDLNKAIEERYIYENEESLDNLIPLFLIKGDVWQYENEWRIVYTRKNMYDFDDYILYSGNLVFPCISNVYLGYRIHPEIRKNIIEICERLSSTGQEVEVYQAKLKNKSYEIEFELIK